MELILILAVAVGLAMDAFAVSLSAGVYEGSGKFPLALKLALVFGFFQGAMCAAGWIAGTGFYNLISAYDHWVAFILLLVIGARMIYGGICGTEEARMDLSAPHMLLFLGVATSIDALAVGLSLAVLNTGVIVPAVVIGIVTFVISFAGVYIGGRFGEFIGRYAEFAGGAVLILIGAMVLSEGILI